MADSESVSSANTSVDKNQTNMAVLAHLSTFVGILIPFGNIFAPLIIWFMKKKESVYVEEHAREALNFQISTSIYTLIAVALTIILIGIPLLIGILIFDLVCTIKAALAASKGEKYHYPLSIRLVK